MNYVIGSGPSGVMCAKGLLDANQEVTMIDVGSEPPEHVNKLKGNLADKEPESWDSISQHSIKKIIEYASLHEEIKLHFGSGFCYSKKNEDNICQSNTHCLISNAKGGLSNVWGAGILPMAREDFEKWPVNYDVMADYYKKVSENIPISGVNDDLESVYPYFGEYNEGVKLSNQSKYLLKVMNTNREILNRKGVIFGQSRLAVTTHNNYKNRCRYCGMCLTGCPYESIYNSRHNVDTLIKHPKFRYINNIYVEKLSRKNKNEIEILCIDVKNNKRLVFNGNKVFVASGPLATLKIIANSLNMDNVKLKMKYQAYFIIPGILLNYIPNIYEEKLNTLSQIFIQIRNSNILDKNVHLSLYTFNPLFKHRLDKYIKLDNKFTKYIKILLLGRLIALQGFIDPDNNTSGSIDVVIKYNNGNSHITLQGEPYKFINQQVKKVTRFLMTNTRNFGFIPLPFLKRTGLPGEGNHFGCTFPMMEKPKKYQTDKYGRLSDMPDVHIVDSSVLTTLPTGPFTYTIMANAYRIGHESVI